MVVAFFVALFLRVVVVVATPNTTCWSKMKMTQKSSARTNQDTVMFCWHQVHQSTISVAVLKLKFFLGWSRSFSSRGLPQFCQMETKTKLTSPTMKMSFEVPEASRGQLENKIACFHCKSVDQIFTLIAFPTLLYCSFLTRLESNNTLRFPCFG